MAGDVSFDVVSDFDRQELVNALDQVRREIDDPLRLQGRQGRTSSWARTRSRCGPTRRCAPRRSGTSSSRRRSGAACRSRSSTGATIEPAGGNTVRQRSGCGEGLPEDLAKKITKLIRDDFPKVKSQIQGDAVRVSGKSKDELQRVIARLREEGEGYPVALQFKNYR